MQERLAQARDQTELCRLIPLAFRRCADEVKPLGAIRCPCAEGIEDFYGSKFDTQGANNPPQRKCGLGNFIMNQVVAFPPLMLENFHVPDILIARRGRDFDDHQVPDKPLFPGRAFGETLQLAEGVDVEDK